MPNPRPLTMCLIVTFAVIASGCGSSKTTTKTSTAAAANEPPQTASTQSTGSTGAPTTTKAPEPQATKRKKPIEFNEKASEKDLMKARAKQTGVPFKRQYPLSAQQDFTSVCTAAGGSKSTCECVIKKLELSPREKGNSLGELLATDVALRRASLASVLQGLVQVPYYAIRDIRACRKA